MREKILVILLSILAALLLCAGCAPTQREAAQPETSDPAADPLPQEEAAAPEEAIAPAERDASVEAPQENLVETLLVTVADNINGKNTDDGVEAIVCAYNEQTQAFQAIFRTPIGPYVYPANTVDFEHQIVYYASARQDEAYDNLYSCDLKTGEVQRLTDGKNAFDDLLFVDGTLYANVAREFCTTCQPARFDLDSQTFTYRNEADDDTWHHSFSYDEYADEFLILTCSDSEMRTHRVAAETHIRPKTISLLDRLFENVTPLFFIEDYEVYLTRRLDEDTILMTTEPQMVGTPRTLKRLDIASQEVEDFAIPGIRQVYLFYPSLDGNTLYFIGQAEGSTIWNVYRYALDTQELTQLTFPKQPDRIIDIQITRQPCGPDFSQGCCTVSRDEPAYQKLEREWYEEVSTETERILLYRADDGFSTPLEITDEDAVREIVSAIDFPAWVPLSDDEIPREGPGYFLDLCNGTVIGILPDEPVGFVGRHVSFEREAGELVNCILEGGPDGAFAFSQSLLDVVHAAAEAAPQDDAS